MCIDKVIFVIFCFITMNWTGLYGSGQTVCASTMTSTAPDQDHHIMSILETPSKLETPSFSSLAVEKRETSIFGTPEVTKEQIIKYILRHNPEPKLTCSVEELVNIYYEEAGLEGVRPDLAITQAILETGFFRYGGDVLPEQNNYAGIGATGNSRGIWLSSARDGVIAHVQHLLAYATTRNPLKPIVDPRYYIVREIHLAQCPSWESLNGKWAAPGTNYGQRILNILERVKQI